MVKVTVGHLKEELTQRYDLSVAYDEDEKPKKPKLSGTIKKLADRLCRTSDDGSPTYPLKYTSERRWLVNMFESVLGSIAGEANKEAERKMQRGDHMLLSTFLK